MVREPHAVACLTLLTVSTGMYSLLDATFQGLREGMLLGTDR
jgi:hypothetical protein